MAFDTDACRFRNVGDVDITDTGVHRSNLPFFDICWTKIISLRAPENPRKLVAIAAFRLDHPKPIKVTVKLVPLSLVFSFFNSHKISSVAPMSTSLKYKKFFL